MFATTIGKKAQALAAALVLGTALLSVAPGEARAEIREDQSLCTQTLPNGPTLRWATRM
jgi:hypothetical protein